MQKYAIWPKYIQVIITNYMQYMEEIHASYMHCLVQKYAIFMCSLFLNMLKYAIY